MTTAIFCCDAIGQKCLDGITGGKNVFPMYVIPCKGPLCMLNLILFGVALLRHPGAKFLWDNTPEQPISGVQVWYDRIMAVATFLFGKRFFGVIEQEGERCGSELFLKKAQKLQQQHG